MLYLNCVFLLQIISTFENKHNVQFFGDQMTAFIHKTKILPFHALTPHLPVKRPLLQAAISEALAEINCGVLINVTEKPERSLDSGHLCPRSTDPEPTLTDGDKLKSLREEWDTLYRNMPKLVDVIKDLKDLTDLTETFSEYGDAL